MDILTAYQKEHILELMEGLPANTSLSIHPAIGGIDVVINAKDYQKISYKRKWSVTYGYEVEEDHPNIQNEYIVLLEDSILNVYFNHDYDPELKTIFSLIRETVANDKEATSVSVKIKNKMYFAKLIVGVV